MLIFHGKRLNINKLSLTACRSWSRGGGETKTQREIIRQYFHDELFSNGVMPE